MRVLIVEDEKPIADGIASTLREEGHHAEVRYDGDSALELAKKQSFELILLDLNLPKMSGLDFLRAIRALKITSPVLILSARDAVEDRVQGLDLGADDYLSKPFAMPELLARVRALSRRAGEEAGHVVRYGDLKLDAMKRRVWRGEEELDLTAKEFEVLELLLRNACKPVSREMLGKVVWRGVPRATPLNNVIDVHIAHLRRKVDDPAEVRLIHTIRGVGFVLEERK